jgi:hypothetical protein
MEREADADIFAGKLRRFNDVDELLSELKRSPTVNRRVSSRMCGTFWG